MSDLKKLIFKVLEKTPTRTDVNFDKTYHSVFYIDEEKSYDIVIYKNKDGYEAEINIFNAYRSSRFVCELTEKEYMQLKWQMEEWNTYILDKDFDLFEEFANKSKGSIDDLLDD